MSSHSYEFAPARVERSSLNTALAPVPAVCFVGALVTDLVYLVDPQVQWETFSIWLITAGIVFGVLALIAGAIDAVANRHKRSPMDGWVFAIGSLVALALSVVNAMVHSRDGYTAVVPQGLLLSGLVVAILLATQWLGRRSARRRIMGNLD